MDPYSFLTSFMKRDKDGVAILPMKNTPSRFSWDRSQYLDLHGLKIADSKVIEGKALFLKRGKELPAGFEIIVFGDYVRRASNGEKVEVVRLARCGGDERTLYLRIDEKCPGLYANDPSYSDDTKHIKSDGEIMEFQERDYGSEARVCIVLHKKVIAHDAHRELWITYNLASVDDNPSIRVAQTSTTTRKARSVAPVEDSASSILFPGEGDDTEDEDAEEADEGDDGESANEEEEEYEEEEYVDVTA